MYLLGERNLNLPPGCVTTSRVAEVGVAQATSPGTCRPRARRKTVLLLLVSGPGFQGLDMSPPDPCYRLAPPVERLSGPTSPAFCFMEEDVSS